MPSDSNTPTNSAQHCDYLIIGSGAAGLMAAHRLANHGKVILVNKSDFPDSNTFQAQGGIAGFITKDDSIESHIEDTIKAGAGLCHADVVSEVVNHGHDMVEELLQLGTPFDTENGELHLTREGGHSHRRIAHVQDSTGKAIGETLLSYVQKNPNITCLQRHMVVDLITTYKLGIFNQKNQCLGAYILPELGEVFSIAAKHVVLATGGAGKVYMYTSNPHAATGDGIAMAWRAGCPVMNLEFMQFHPTCLYNPSGSTMLLTEALRGEGAHLIDKNGRRFAFDDDERGELAPRDIVARAIDREIKKTGEDCMYLDVTHLGADKINSQFPNIQRRLLAMGLDMSKQPIPIVPAAHYMCGGVQTDVSGATAVTGLSVIGEAACTGLHGANRLASNSLLECLVMADQCAARIVQEPSTHKSVVIPAWDSSGVVPEQERVQIKQNWDEIRAIMSNYVGIVRTSERLRRARRRLFLIHEEIAEYYWQHPLSRSLLELRNLALLADLMIRSAQQRHESRGLHYTTDYPNQAKEAKDTILLPQGDNI
ncbi:L-aspartate oxidase [Ghiorsea bivora]|uniref:L-aspartate oxidase n=1 Tax=Ghiorsea bivora TaxID=1485545 RepID=UPI00068A2E55|nr:L-aspartate oxidase [Ghiorsea bivora]